MLPSFSKQTITIIRPTFVDERGSLVPDWDNPEKTITVDGCSVQPATTSLSQDGRVLGISDGWTAYLPEGTDVQAGDHVMYNDDTYDINGEPRVWQGPMRTSHIQLNLIRWEG